jgi:hypothetical protein
VSCEGLYLLSAGSLQIMTTTRIRIHAEDPRLKRGIEHDARSWDYRLDTSGLDVVAVEWPLLIERLNQQRVGKCTAEAATEVLGSAPFYTTLNGGTGPRAGELTDTWSDGFYSDEETLDGDGPYPPNDNGSTGLTSAKVAQARGLIAGYQHTFTTVDALKGLSLRPACWGTLWRSGMDEVNTDTGQVRYTGGVRGGHELSLYKVVPELEQVWFHNHWGAWGYRNSGDAWISFEDFDASLSDQGDVTFYNPATAPAPTPAPAGNRVTLTDEALAILNSWAGLRHAGVNAKAASAWKTGVQA